MIESEIKKRAEIFESYWRKHLSGNDPRRLYDASRHLLLAGGKRLRPCLAMLACESSGGEAERVLPFAAAIEFVHCFTLIHDDIMDKSTLRRSQPTVHVKYGESTAILAGDVLFAKAFEAMYDLSIDPIIWKNLEYKMSLCTVEICEGQELDIEFESRSRVTENEYLEMIRKKTAVIFKLAAYGGGIIGNADEKSAEMLGEYGLNLGLAFQIWDDYLDISSTEEILGKDIGNDIRNGKKTLIAVHALAHAKGADKKLINGIFSNPKATDDDIQRLLDLFKDLGSVEYAKKVALSYVEKAQNALDKLPDTKAKEILNNLAAYTIQREK
ncbi:MAG: polyprenyl synthetase family protein [Candidatus Thermoplasmatota archaeon]